MKFWGAEVKSGEVLKVEAGYHFLLHLSQACLGDAKKDKGSERVCLYARVGDKKVVLGGLFPGKLPQLSFDLVFERDFELSHDWKKGSVHFIGYKVPTDHPVMRSDDDPDLDDETDDDLLVVADKGKTESHGELSKAGKELDDSGDEEYDDSFDTKAMILSGEDEEDTGEDDDESDDEDEETPEKVLGEKRSAASDTQTLVPNKKAKFVTPQRTEGKKVVAHVATPHPSKLAAKPTGTTEQKQDKSQKAFPCRSCGKSFGSDQALQDHTKAKHSAGY